MKLVDMHYLKVVQQLDLALEKEYRYRLISFLPQLITLMDQ